MQRDNTNTTQALWLPIGLSILALALAISGTRWSIGVAPDSVTYFTSPVAGAGVHAPFYAWLLSALDSIGMDKVVAARWLNIGLLVGTVSLVWFALFRSLGSNAAATIGAVLVLMSPKILGIHGVALSDALFLFLAVAALLALARYLETGRYRLLILAATLAAVGFLTRFAGSPVVLAGALALLFIGQARLKRRILDAGLFAAVGAGPMLARLVISRLNDGMATGREAGLLGNDVLARLYGGVNEMSLYLLPAQIPATLRVGLLIALILATAVLFAWYMPLMRRGEQENRPVAAFSKLPQVLAIFIVCYAVFLVTTVLIQPFIPIRSRYLSPVYVSGVLMVTMLVYASMKPCSWRRAGYLAFVILATGLTMSNTARSTKWVVENFQDGAGYASRAWQTSELVTRIKNDDSGVPIYSNAREALVFLTRKDVQKIPRETDPILGKPNPSYRAELEAMRDDLVRHDGLVVYFNTVHWRWYLPSASKLEKELGLQVKATAADGVIYQPKRAGRVEGPMTDTNDMASGNESPRRIQGTFR